MTDEEIGFAAAWQKRELAPHGVPPSSEQTTLSEDLPPLSSAS